MIQPNELRIGNWVTESEFSSRKNNPDPYQISFNDFGYHQLLNPIPLSEDWLKRFGFEPNGVFKSMKILLPDSERATKTYIVVTFDEEAWIQIEQERKEILGDRELTRTKEMQSGTFRCAYVHQLQNLFHSLTGEELTLSE